MITTSKRAFSLAEAMVAITVITLILAVTVPILIKSQNAPSDTPWGFVTLGDLSHNSAIYTATGGASVAVFGDKRVPIDVNITDDKSKVFAKKINPKISVVARNHSDNPLISRHLIDFYEKDAEDENTFYSIGKVSFDNYYNLALGKNALDNAEQSATSSIANFSNFDDNTLWTDLTDETDTNLKGALNTAIGQYAMGGDRKYLADNGSGTVYPTRNMSGSANTAVGAFAMRRNTIGDFNTAVGAYALESATDTNTGKGNSNVAVGYKALRLNQTGSDNVAVGQLSLMQNTTGLKNVAVGAFSHEYNVSGNNNLTVGYKALMGIKTGSNNVAIGGDALNNAIHQEREYIGNNMAVVSFFDISFANANSVSENNVAVGHSSQRGKYDSTHNTSNNVSVGYGSISGNVTGNNNTAVGYCVLYDNTTGSNNVGIGGDAIALNTTGSNNISIGMYSLYRNTTGRNNTANGGFSLYSNTTGSNNTVVGHSGLYNNTSGSNNTALGYNSASGINSSNKLYITANSSYYKTDSLIYGTDSDGARKLYFNVTNKQAYLTGSADGDKIITKDEMDAYAAPKTALLDTDILNTRIAYSDRRLKNIIGDNKSGLKEILQLKVKNYTFKNDAKKEKRVGVTAQELQKVFPNSVFEGLDGYLKIKRDEIFYACVNAIKELNSMFREFIAKVSGLDKKITALEEKNKMTEERIKILEEKNKRLKKRISEYKKTKQKINRK